MEYHGIWRQSVKISVEGTPIKDVLIVVPELFQDSRGFFQEAYRADQFAELGLPASFVQFNHSGSIKTPVGGLLSQWEPPMGKLMRVSRGTAFLAAVDIRKRSPSLGKWLGVTLSEQDRRWVWAPAGFGRGFAVLS